LSVIDNIIVTY